MTITLRLLKNLVEAAYQDELAARDEVDETAVVPRPTLGPPATKQQLQTLSAFLAKKHLPFPPSLRTFLSLANGIENFRPSPFGDALWLLNTTQLMQRAHRGDHRLFPSLAKFNLARGESLEFIAFDVEVMHGAEPEVEWVTAEGESTRFRSLERFLREYLVLLKQ